MRILTFVLCLCVSLPALAQTAISEDIANAYYQNCLRQPTPMMSNDAKDLMCSCTAVKMMETMSIEDVQTMSSETDQARLAVNKMLINVYAPCIEFPAKDYYYNTCLKSPDTAEISRKPQALCDCMSSEVASFLGQNATGVFSDILSRNPRILDPMDALANDPEFKQFAQNKLLACYARNR